MKKIGLQDVVIVKATGETAVVLAVNIGSYQLQMLDDNGEYIDGKTCILNKNEVELKASYVSRTRVYKIAMELLMNEAYDMQEEYSNEDIAYAVQQIVVKLNRQKRDEVEVELCGSPIKVRNNEYRSFVSFSVNNETGLAESIAEITDISRPIQKDDVKTLIEMINEAWYEAVA